MSSTAQPVADLEAVAADSVSAASWHSTMGGFVDLHYEQTMIYAEADRGGRASYFQLKAGGTCLAGARVDLYTVPVVNSGIALIRFGPFWRRADIEEQLDAYRRLLEALIQEYCDRRRLFLVIRPRPHPDFYPREAALLVEAGFSPSAGTSLDRYFADVRLDETEQLKGFDKTWRYNLRKGQGNGMEIRFADDPATVETFQSLYWEMVRRKSLNYPGFQLPRAIPDLMALPDRMRMHIVLAYSQGEPIAGAAFSIVGDLAYYVFGASGDKATELQAGYVLQWEILRWLRDHTSVRWYELGGPGDPGIRSFKKGLAGKRGVLLNVQEFERVSSAKARLIARSLYWLRNLRNQIQKRQRQKLTSQERNKE